ncbi:hypothetical protein Pmani_035867 [Petrolisthes manimaculis]|uniref:Uncharacterized protein n=1 Tax=Petrolisthes manimaculis TaxID=1843537 RepID=A0AAE1TMR7_9EUCA|nr:hypothetical protein Pmani_035867 [Petrolisthes manimaculis]
MSGTKVERVEGRKDVERVEKMWNVWKKDVERVEKDVERVEKDVERVEKDVERVEKMWNEWKGGHRFPNSLHNQMY